MPSMKKEAEAHSRQREYEVGSFDSAQDVVTKFSQRVKFEADELLYLRASVESLLSEDSEESPDLGDRQKRIGYNTTALIDNLVVDIGFSLRLIEENTYSGLREGEPPDEWDGRFYQGHTPEAQEELDDVFSREFIEEFEQELRLRREYDRDIKSSGILD